MQTQRFQPGETLTWTKVEESVPTRRSVKFAGYQAGGGGAVVEFGFSAEGNPVRYSINNLAELSRPQPAPQAPPYHQAPISAPRIPEPQTETEILAVIMQRREALSAAHARLRHARDAVTSAATLSKRAEAEYSAAKAALSAFDRHSKAEELALETAIREGKPSPEAKPNGHDRQYILDRVGMTAGPRDKFAAELVEAQAVLNAALTDVRKAAQAVIGAMVDREVLTLHQTQEYVIRLRSDLLAISGWWPGDASDGPIQLSPASAHILTAPPLDLDRVGRGVSTATVTAPYKDLLDRLVNGDADADFRLEK